MGYRIEFLVEDNTRIHTPLNEVRFPSLVLAIAAARLGVRALARPQAAPVLVSIFDRQERLASRLQLAVPEQAFVDG